MRSLKPLPGPIAPTAGASFALGLGQTLAPSLANTASNFAQRYLAQKDMEVQRVFAAEQARKAQEWDRQKLEAELGAREKVANIGAGATTAAAKTRADATRDATGARVTSNEKIASEAATAAQQRFNEEGWQKGVMGQIAQRFPTIVPAETDGIARYREAWLNPHTRQDAERAIEAEMRKLQAVHEKRLKEADRAKTGRAKINANALKGKLEETSQKAFVDLFADRIGQEFSRKAFAFSKNTPGLNTFYRTGGAGLMALAPKLYRQEVDGETKAELWNLMSESVAAEMRGDRTDPTWLEEHGKATDLATEELLRSVSGLRSTLQPRQ